MYFIVGLLSYIPKMWY